MVTAAYVAIDSLNSNLGLHTLQVPPGTISSLLQCACSLRLATWTRKVIAACRGRGVAGLRRRKVRRLRAFYEMHLMYPQDNRPTTSRPIVSNCRAPSPTPRPLAPRARHDGRPPEIPPSESVVVASTGPPPQPRHIALQARNNSYDMAQGKRGAAAGGAVGDTRKEEHRGDAPESNPDILRTQLAMPILKSHTNRLVGAK
jgi:hypothetical protein